MKRLFIAMLALIAGMQAGSCWCDDLKSSTPPRFKYEVARSLDIVVPKEYAKFKKVKAAEINTRTAKAVISLIGATQQVVAERRKDKATTYDDLSIAQIALTYAWNEAIIGLWDETADLDAKRMIIDEWNKSLIDSPDTRFQIDVLTVICWPSRITGSVSGKSDLGPTTRFVLSEPKIPADFLTLQFLRLFKQTRDRELLGSFIMLFGNYGSIAHERLLREKLVDIRANPGGDSTNQKMIEIGLVAAIRAMQRTRIQGIPRGSSEPKADDGLPWP